MKKLLLMLLVVGVSYDLLAKDYALPKTTICGVFAGNKFLKPSPLLSWLHNYAKTPVSTDPKVKNALTGLSYATLTVDNAKDSTEVFLAPGIEKLVGSKFVPACEQAVDTFCNKAIVTAGGKKVSICTAVTDLSKLVPLLFTQLTCPGNILNILASFPTVQGFAVGDLFASILADETLKAMLINLLAVKLGSMPQVKAEKIKTGWQVTAVEGTKLFDSAKVDPATCKPYPILTKNDKAELAAELGMTLDEYNEIFGE